MCCLKSFRRSECIYRKVRESMFLESFPMPHETQTCAPCSSLALRSSSCVSPPNPLRDLTREFLSTLGFSKRMSPLLENAFFRTKNAKQPSAPR